MSYLSTVNSSHHRHSVLHSCLWLCHRISRHTHLYFPPKLQQKNISKFRSSAKNQGHKTSSTSTIVFRMLQQFSLKTKRKENFRDILTLKQVLSGSKDIWAKVSISCAKQSILTCLPKHYALTQFMLRLI